MYSERSGREVIVGKNLEKDVQDSKDMRRQKQIVAV